MSYLTEEQLKTLHRKLLEAEENIAALLDQTAADTKPVDLNLPIGRLTRIDAIQMQGMAQMNRHQLTVRQKQVEAALQAFERGTYGLCRHCGEGVAFARLDVLPESPFCVHCQESFEQNP